MIFAGRFVCTRFLHNREKRIDNFAEVEYNRKSKTYAYFHNDAEMVEWSIAAVLKTSRFYR